MSTYSRKFLLGFLLLLMLFGCGDRVTTFKPGQIWNDTAGEPINAHGGGIYVENGIYYWFGEYKTEGSAGNTAQVGVSVYSSNDLYNWDNRGIALQVDDTDSLSDIIKGCIIERPKVIYNKKTGLYVMYFHLELRGQGYSTARTGIAVSKTVVGPYSYLKSVRPNPGIMPAGIYKDSMDYLLNLYCSDELKCPDFNVALRFTELYKEQSPYSLLRASILCIKHRRKIFYAQENSSFVVFLRAMFHPILMYHYYE